MKPVKTKMKPVNNFISYKVMAKLKKKNNKIIYWMFADWEAY